MFGSFVLLFAFCFQHFFFVNKGSKANLLNHFVLLVVSEGQSA